MKYEKEWLTIEFESEAEPESGSHAESLFAGWYWPDGDVEAREKDFWDWVLAELESDPLGVAVRALRHYGVEVPDGWWDDPALGVLVAEAVNWAAKTESYGFYAIKPVLVAWLAGFPAIENGWGDDGTYTLYHREAGAVCFHDPNGELDAAGADGRWKHPWSGVQRQARAFRALCDVKYRRVVAWATRPENRAWVTRSMQNLAGPVNRLP